MKPVRKRREVSSDIADIYAWMAGRNLGVAERFLIAVDSTFEQIAKHPGIGWSRHWRNRKLEGLRSWRVDRFPEFLVFYREQDTEIEVFGVLRSARHLVRALARR